VLLGEVVIDSRTFSVPAVIFATIIGVFVLTRISGVVIRWTVNRIAKRSMAAPARWWRTRARRDGLETSEMTEQRRRQRVDAASRMINHLISVVVWLVTAIALLNLLDINAAFYLTSAGFLGAALAFGGQHKVNDYLTGLSVHVEDRYGIGDEVEFNVGWNEPVRAVVDHVGLFSTRVRDATSTMHFANAALSSVRNLSQEPAVATIRVRSAGRAPEDVARAVRDLAGSSDLTQVVFLGDLTSHQPSTGEVEIDVHTLRPLDARAAETLKARAEEALGVAELLHARADIGLDDDGSVDTSPADEVRSGESGRDR